MPLILLIVLTMQMTLRMPTTMLIIYPPAVATNKLSIDINKSTVTNSSEAARDTNKVEGTTEIMTVMTAAAIDKKYENPVITSNEATKSIMATKPLLFFVIAAATVITITDTIISTNSDKPTKIQCHNCQEHFFNQNLLAALLPQLS